MELNLNQSAIDCYDRVFSQTLRKEDSQDTVVPDTLPDIGGILCTSGNALIRSKDVGEGRLRLEANVPAKVSYVTEEGDGLYCLEVNVPLYVSVEDDAITEKTLCVADLKLAALETRVLNPRKVSVRAEAVFTVECYAEARMAFSGAPAEAVEGVNVLERSMTVTPVCAVTEKTFVLTDEFTIPASLPAAETILAQQTLAQLEDVKTVGSKIVLTGSVKSSLLYRSADMAAGAVDFSTGFSQVVDVDGLPEDAYVSVRLLLSGAYYDLTGEDGRVGSMELHLVAQAVVCGNCSVTGLADAYSNRYVLEAVTEPVEIERTDTELVLRETLREKLETPRPVAEIIQGSYDLGTPRADGDAVTLPVTVCMHYRGSDGCLYSAKRSFQMKFSCDLAEGQRLEPAGASAQELFLTPSAEGAELRLPLELRVFVRGRETVDCVTAVTCDEDAKTDLSDRPTLVILRAASGDDLWTLAKENASTVQAITEANDLDALTAPWERLILIPKTP